MMRIGMLCRADGMERARELGFRSVQLVRFADSPLAPPNPDWRPFAESVMARARALDLRISALGVLYKNPLDPPQTEGARMLFRRAVEVAAFMGVKTVSGFAGAVIETTFNERGGNPVYRPFENHLPQLLAFWEPLAAMAADRGVRIAFEHCPQGAWHLPVMGYNMMAQPAMWERLFNATRHENLGIEWDPSHLVCQFIDPVENIRRYGGRFFHVHAKDAFIDRRLLEIYGPCHPGVAEHRMPGFGQSDWAQIIHTLLRTGYDSDLNIEGWHDPVWRNHGEAPLPPDVSHNAPVRLKGVQWEEAGLQIARRTLERYLPERERV